MSNCGLIFSFDDDALALFAFSLSFPCRDLDPAEVEALNEDVMKDVIKQKSKNPPQFRFV